MPLTKASNSSLQAQLLVQILRSPFYTLDADQILIVALLQLLRRRGRPQILFLFQNLSAHHAVKLGLK